MPAIMPSRAFGSRELPSGQRKLSVASPTYNQAANVEPLLAELEQQLHDVEHEIIVVDDDSPDLTWQCVREFANQNARVRVLRRTAGRDLSRAVFDGFLQAGGDVLCCMDGDLQHDPAGVPRMLAEMDQGSDLVVASRYVAGGKTSGWGWSRRVGSRVATWLARVATGVTLRHPISGSFMVRRADLLRANAKMHPDGFKIVLEMVAGLRPAALREGAYTFRARKTGTSKLHGRIVLQYCRQLGRLLCTRG